MRITWPWCSVNTSWTWMLPFSLIHFPQIHLFYKPCPTYFIYQGNLMPDCSGSMPLYFVRHSPRRVSSIPWYSSHIVIFFQCIFPPTKFLKLWLYTWGIFLFIVHCACDFLSIWPGFLLIRSKCLTVSERSMFVPICGSVSQSVPVVCETIKCGPWSVKRASK